MTDLETRLRATYAAVAERTPVDARPFDPADTTLLTLVEGDSPLSPGLRRRRRRWPLVAAAAAVVVCLAGVAVLVRSDRQAVPTIEQLRNSVSRAVLSVIPEGFGLVEIQSFDDGNRLVYTDGTTTITVSATPVASLPDGGIGPLGPGIITSEEDGVGRATWRVNDSVVLVEVSPGDEARAAAIADTVGMVTEDAWTVLAQRSGFTEVTGETLEQAEYSPGFPGIFGDHGRLTRRLDGSLQAGVRLGIGCCEVLPAQTLRMSVGFRDERSFLVLAPAGTRSVTVGLDGIMVVDVEPVPDPLSPNLMIASFELPPEIDLDEFRARGTAVAVLPDGSTVTGDVG